MDAAEVLVGTGAADGKAFELKQVMYLDNFILYIRFLCLLFFQ